MIFCRIYNQSSSGWSKGIIHKACCKANKSYGRRESQPLWSFADNDHFIFSFYIQSKV